MKKLVPTDASLVPQTAELVFSGIVYDVYQWQQKLYDGSYKTFEMAKKADSVDIFAIVDDTFILLEDEQPQRDMVLTMPCGGVDATDATPLEAAKRELLEETGYSFENWKLIEVIQPSERLEWFVHVFIAWGAYKKTEQNIDAGERINVLFKTYKEVMSLAHSGEKRFKESATFYQSDSLESFKNTPEFSGKEVDR